MATNLLGTIQTMAGIFKNLFKPPIPLQPITKEEIYDVKGKKFSFLKSLGLIIVTPFGLIFLFLALGGGM